MENLDSAGSAAMTPNKREIVEKDEKEQKVATATKPERELRRARSFGIEMVDLHVGPEKNRKHFKVHKALLCRRVKVFDRMFNGKFLEALESKATFPDDDPASFAILIEWVYTNTIINPTPGDWRLVPTFAIAEKYQMPDFMQAVMDCIILWYNEHKALPSFYVLRAAYELTTEGSALRRFCAWVAAICMGRPHGWTFKEEDFETLLKEVKGLLGDALDVLRKFDGAVPRPFQMVDGAYKLSYKVEKSTPNTG